MLFERTKNWQRTVFFEFDKETGIHEQVVACNALGTLTAWYSQQRGQHMGPARLGERIARLPRTQQEAEKVVPIVSSTRLLRKEALLLCTGLDIYEADTPRAIQSFLHMGNEPMCNVRAIQGELARDMTAVLQDEFSIEPLPVKPRFGFY